MTNRCEWILREAAAGEVFAAGHAESGNETSVVMSITKAERVDGGYKFTGRKSFGSLTPVWTRLGLHGLDTSDPAAPKVVHAFLPRDAGNFSIKETWDVLGMRATRSDDTVLDGAFVPDKYIARVVPMGFAGADLFVLSIFAWALVGFGNVYYGLARRVLELTVDQVKSRSSIALTRSMAYHPEVQHDVAEMVMELEAIGAQLETVARDWSEGVEAPRLADQDRRGEVPRGRGGLADRRPRDGRLGGLRDVQEERARTPVPRRSRRPFPPGELGAVARSRRQARAGNQSGRNTQVGLTQSTVGSRGSAVAVGRTVNSQSALEVGNPSPPSTERRAPSAVTIPR